MSEQIVMNLLSSLVLIGIGGLITLIANMGPSDQNTSDDSNA